MKPLWAAVLKPERKMMFRYMAIGVLGLVILSVKMTYLQYLAVGAVIALVYLIFMGWLLSVWEDETL